VKSPELPYAALPAPSILAREHRQRLTALQNDFRDSLGRIDGDDEAAIQLRAVIETAAETLGGLAEAFGDFAEGDEEAWAD